jgi:hypothetical protein
MWSPNDELFGTVAMPFAACRLRASATTRACL